MTNAANETGFPPVVGKKPKVLVLGSMPGIKSLQEKQYYAHPRNAFWPIMAKLFTIPEALPYVQRLDALKSNHIALWDVIYQCERKGSLDSNIIKDSVVSNNFNDLLAREPSIKTILFNGQAASKLFKKHVDERLLPPIETLVMPSTSPAHASMSLEEKANRWHEIKRFVESN